MNWVTIICVFIFGPYSALFNFSVYWGWICYYTVPIGSTFHIPNSGALQLLCDISWVNTIAKSRISESIDKYPLISLASKSAISGVSWWYRKDQQYHKDII